MPLINIVDLILIITTLFLNSLWGFWFARYDDFPVRVTSTMSDGAEPPLVLYRIILNPLNTKPKRMINLQTIYICHHPLSCSIELNRLNIKLKRSDLSSHNVKDPIRLKLFLRPLIHTQNYFQHLFILVLRLNLLNDFLSSFSIVIPPPFLHLFSKYV